MRETRAKGEDAEYDWLVIWRCVLWGGMEQAMVCRQALFFLRLLPSRVSRAQRTSSCFADLCMSEKIQKSSACSAGCVIEQEIL